jgi:hypothetical protein
MKSNGNCDYSRLRSLQALRKERERLDWQIGYQGELISRDWCDIRSALSLKNILRSVLGRLI